MQTFKRKGKPIERLGRKAIGPSVKMAASYRKEVFYMKKILKGWNK
jgi:hypothetical protein